MNRSSSSDLFEEGYNPRDHDWMSGCSLEYNLARRYFNKTPALLHHWRTNSDPKYNVVLISAWSIAEGVHDGCYRTKSLPRGCKSSPQCRHGRR